MTDIGRNAAMHGITAIVCFVPKKGRPLMVLKGADQRPPVERAVRPQTAAAQLSETWKQARPPSSTSRLTTNTCRQANFLNQVPEAYCTGGKDYIPSAADNCRVTDAPRISYIFTLLKNEADTIARIYFQILVAKFYRE
ncbi:hypothetical protein [Mesorhizobium sp. CO1-1-4]|uniref:hypothetical protein n=1 Tax=Mesorhizobium sp. CO1-1-4 TaxID=2876633 RepID=UPI001CCA5DAF|nr:hypothetical protein [Mesorhizobium sp. CO1-1-4]MBZ9739943.1 hypothetical protein [Mesorhizobium sp. CO1-1-4]